MTALAEARDLLGQASSQLGQALSEVDAGADMGTELGWESVVTNMQAARSGIEPIVASLEGLVTEVDAVVGVLQLGAGGS